MLRKSRKIRETNAEVGIEIDNIDVEASPKDMNTFTGIQAYEYEQM